MASNIDTTNIDTAYPVAGQDNDSQGFRDNFTNTNQNFIFAKDEIEALQAASGGNYVFDNAQVPDNSMDNWVLTYDHNGGVDPMEIRLTALPVADATTPGILELADQAEVDAGVNAVTAVTPLTLQTKIDAEIALIPATPTPLTTKGDLITYDVDDVRLPIGADDFVLTADSSAGTGMAWKAAAGGGGGVANPLTADLLTAGFSITTANEAAGLATGWVVGVGSSNAVGTPGDIVISGGNNSAGGYPNWEPGGNVVLAPGVNLGSFGEYAAGTTGFVEIRGSASQYADARFGTADTAYGSGDSPIGLNIFAGTNFNTGGANDGGPITITGGSANALTTAGGITITGGDGAQNLGGTVIVQGGDSSVDSGTSPGGQARLNGGDSGSGDGGTCVISAGNGNAAGRAGGDIEIEVGQGDSNSTSGTIIVSVAGTGSFGKIVYEYPRALGANTVGGLYVYTGTGSPNGAVIANVGAMYTDNAGGAGSTLYVKESGTATNTGWVAK